VLGTFYLRSQLYARLNSFLMRGLIFRVVSILIGMNA